MRKMKLLVHAVILLVVLAVTVWPGNGFDLESKQARIDPNLFNSNAMVFHVNAADLGLTPGDSTFEYGVRIFQLPDWIITDFSGIHSFDPANPGLHLTGTELAPMYWDDLDGATIPVEYDHAAYMRNRSRGLLLIHHHNASGARAEVVDIIPAVEETPRRGGGRVTP